MDQFKGLFILAMGFGVLLISLQGLVRGWLPTGPNGYKRGEGVHREKQPFFFWLFFCLYFGGGAYVMFSALSML